MSDLTIDFIIGHNVQQRRYLAGLSQKELGKLCGVPISAQAISKYELGLTQVTASYLVEFARIFECGVLDFFEGAEHYIVDKREPNKEDMRLLRNYNQLSEPLRDSVREMIRAMAMEGSRNHDRDLR